MDVTFYSDKITSRKIRETKPSSSGFIWAAKKALK